MVGLCLALTVTHAQNVDSVADKVTNFPFKVIKRINGETTSLNQQLQCKTEKYLQSMARKEAKLRAQLYKADSAKAAALYPDDPRKQYAAFIQKFKEDSSRVFSSMGPEYLPHVDSLHSMLAFMAKNSTLLNGNLAQQSTIQSSLANFQQLQAKLQQADVVNQFIQGRKALLQQYVSSYTKVPSGVGNTLQGYNKEVYYYGEQIREYRQMLNDPGKLIQTALGLLNKVPAFTSFMKQNSFLSGVFNVPGGYDNPSGAPGLGTITADAKTSDPKHAGLTTDEAIGAVAGHEIVHATDKGEINKDIKYAQEHNGAERPRSQREAKSEAVEKQIIEESKNND